MKFTTSAAVAIAVGSSVVAAGGADTVNAVLSSIADDLKKFDSAIKAWSGGPIDSLDAASKAIQADTEGGASKIQAGESLTLVDAAGITSNVQGLQTQLDTTLGDLKSIGDKLAAGGHCANLQGQLKSQGAAAQNLQDAITGKAPPEAKSIAQQLGGAIGASIKDTQAAFDKICAGAPSGGASAGGSASSSGSSSGSSGAAAGGAASGSSSSGSSSGAAPKANTGAHASAGGHSKPATATGAPKPATYTGAGSQVKVPFAVALALAVFAL